MKFRLCASILLITTVFTSGWAQSSSQESAPSTRPRIVTLPNRNAETGPRSRQVNASAQPGGAGYDRPLGIAKLRSRIEEAERLLRSRPAPTAYLPKANSLSYVTLAALDPAQSRIHLIAIPKDPFLKRGTEMELTTSQGTPVTLRVLRANGVNTAVTLVDQNGRNFTPLLVQYPIERGGRVAETAYYTSVHPALLSPELVSAGQSYLHAMLDASAKRLRAKGVPVSAQIVSIAERLCIVEHADHVRFRAESHSELFNEIYALFALNEGNTFRYAVSFAGAGGIAQMMPATYQMIRQGHPNVSLTPDFVNGMRNHANALDAMLLYMTDTWNLLSSNDDVQYALDHGQATPSELMAAGYNSNPARLPKYLREGRGNWRTLIPQETQTYLQIYKSLDSLRSGKHG